MVGWRVQGYICDQLDQHAVRVGDDCVEEPMRPTCGTSVEEPMGPTCVYMRGYLPKPGAGGGGGGGVGVVSCKVCRVMRVSDAPAPIGYYYEPGQSEAAVQ